MLRVCVPLTVYGTVPLLVLIPELKWVVAGINLSQVLHTESLCVGGEEAPVEFEGREPAKRPAQRTPAIWASRLAAAAANAAHFQKNDARRITKYLENPLDPNDQSHDHGLPLSLASPSAT